MDNGGKKVLTVAGTVTVAGAVTFVLLWGGLWEQLLGLFSSRESVQRAVERAGALAPAAYVLLLLLQAVLAPLPAPAVAAAGGFLFGTFKGFVLTWAGALLGGAACFGISRVFGRRFVLRSERAKRLDDYVEEHGAFAVFVLRLIPLLSFDAISYAAGLSAISFWKFLLATALGMVPGTFVFVYLGRVSPGPGLWAAMISVAAVLVVAYVCFRRRAKTRRMLFSRR